MFFQDLMDDFTKHSLKIQLGIEVTIGNQVLPFLGYHGKGFVCRYSNEDPFGCWVIRSKGAHFGIYLLESNYMCVFTHICTYNSSFNVSVANCNIKRFAFQFTFFCFWNKSCCEESLN